jgi:hypothetical protein
VSKLLQERIYHVTNGSATFGIITQRYGDTVIDAAPIARWTIGKKIADVLRYYNKRRAIIHVTFIRYMKGHNNG